MGGEKSQHPAAGAGAAGLEAGAGGEAVASFRRLLVAELAPFGTS